MLHFLKKSPNLRSKCFLIKGERVIDPFAGLGTSIKVANELGRIGIGLERDLSLKEAMSKFIGQFEEYKV